MESIYFNALVNIGVSHARNPFEGAFVQREPSRIEQNSFQWRPTSKSARSDFAVITEESLMQIQDLFQLPLYSRGWCMQERILCPRMLHFGSFQLHWECDQEPHASESLPAGIDDALFTREEWPEFNFTSFQKRSARQEAGETSLERARYETSAPIELWRQILEEYSLTELTYPEKDILKAIEGMATYFRATSPQIALGGYRWGCFSRILPYLLDWSSMGRARISSVPSWSWASGYGSVGFFYSDFRTAKPLICCFGDRGQAIDDVSLVCVAKLFLIERSKDAGPTEWIKCSVHMSDPSLPRHMCFHVNILFERSRTARSPDSKFALMGLYESRDTISFLVLRLLPNGSYQRVGFGLRNMFTQDDLPFDQLYSNTRPQVVVIV